MKDELKSHLKIILITLTLTTVVCAIIIYFGDIFKRPLALPSSENSEDEYKEYKAPEMSLGDVANYIYLKELKNKNDSIYPYIIGKVVMVDIMPDPNTCDVIMKPRYGWNNINDTEFLEIPQDLRATKPEEIGTIVWLKWSAVELGNYFAPSKLKHGGTAPVEYYAYRLDCEVTIIDRTNNTIVKKFTFQGGHPPYRLTSGMENEIYTYVKNNAVCGTRPTQKIIEYITSLPRRSLSEEHK